MDFKNFFNLRIKIKIQNNIFFQKVRDYSVSKEIFELHHNPEYDILITFPKPSLEKLPSYYESDDYISHTDGKRSLFERAYHFIKGIALKNKLKLINGTKIFKRGIRQTTATNE